MYILYILKCSDGTLYTGITNDLEKRMKVHNSGKGAKYVRARLPFDLVYSETQLNKSDALKREIVIKKMSRAEKMRMIKLLE
jgi:putative endonuclease